MEILYSVIGITISVLCLRLFMKLDEKAISKGNYIQSKWNGKFTIWSILYYISFIMLGVSALPLLEFVL